LTEIVAFPLGTPARKQLEINQEP